MIDPEYKNIHMPCFGCPDTYICRYFKNSLWDSWILTYHECPATKYTFESLYYALKEKYKEKPKKQHSSHMTKLIK